MKFGLFKLKRYFQDLFTEQRTCSSNQSSKSGGNVRSVSWARFFGLLPLRFWLEAGSPAVEQNVTNFVVAEVAQKITLCGVRRHVQVAPAIVTGLVIQVIDHRLRLEETDHTLQRHMLALLGFVPAQI